MTKVRHNGGFLAPWLALLPTPQALKSIHIPPVALENYPLLIGQGLWTLAEHLEICALGEETCPGLSA